MMMDSQKSAEHKKDFLRILRLLAAIPRALIRHCADAESN
jgi:hypothetical protein